MVDGYQSFSQTCCRSCIAFRAQLLRNVLNMSFHFADSYLIHCAFFLQEFVMETIYISTWARWKYFETKPLHSTTFI